MKTKEEIEALLSAAEALLATAPFAVFDVRGAHQITGVVDDVGLSLRADTPEARAMVATVEPVRFGGNRPTYARALVRMLTDDEIRNGGAAPTLLRDLCAALRERMLPAGTDVAALLATAESALCAALRESERARVEAALSDMRSPRPLPSGFFRCERCGCPVDPATVTPFARMMQKHEAETRCIDALLAEKGRAA